jgi:cellobiose phosphorylase
MYRIAVQWLLGIDVEGDRLRIQPCVPSSWSRYSVRLRRGRTTYEIAVEPGESLDVEVDGALAADGVVHMIDDGHLHAVVAKRRRANQLTG